MKTLYILLLSILLIGCTNSKVILLADQNNNIGKVIIETKKEKLILKDENTLVITSNNRNEITKLSVSDINDEYKDLLNSQPEYPSHFTYVFNLGEYKISDKSVFKKIIQTIKRKKSCDISVIGHSDTVGTNDINKEISLKRAKSARDIIQQYNINPNCIDIRYYGENDLAVKTADNVSEIQNRRVEIEIR